MALILPVELLLCLLQNGTAKDLENVYHGLEKELVGSAADRLTWFYVAKALANYRRQGPEAERITVDFLTRVLANMFLEAGNNGK